MTCREIKTATGVTAIVCSRGGKRPKKCSVCKAAEGTKLCDAPVAGGTCDAPMCDRCTFSPEAGVDHCPRHRRDPAAGSNSEKRKRTTFEREESWSKSAGAQFAECARAYWLARIGMWGGWEKGATEKQRRLYLLKNLDGRHGWIGKVVHEALLEALRAELGGWPLSDEQARERLLNRLRYDFAQSKRGTYRSVPKSFGLIEHELGESVPDKWWAESREQAIRCLRNGMRSNAYTRAVMSGSIRAVEDKSNFAFGGTKVWVQPDLAFDREAGLVELVDWKTGRPKASDTDQLALYGAFAVATWGVPIERCVGTLVYLDELDEVSFPLSAGDVELAEQIVRTSIEQIRARDPEDENAWPTTDNPKTCRFCNFRRDCPGGQRL